MDKRTKVKAATTLVCMILSLIALYGFLFVLEVSTFWRTILVLLAVSWIVSGVINLYTYFKKDSTPSDHAS